MPFEAVWMHQKKCVQSGAVQMQKKTANNTSEPQHYTIKMYASTVIAFTDLYRVRHKKVAPWSFQQLSQQRLGILM